MSPDLVAALGGLTGLGALITSTAGLLETRRRLRPNHGSSVADGIARIETAQAKQGDDLRDLRAFVGHEIGEVRRDASREHADYDARIRALEARKR